MKDINKLLEERDISDYKSIAVFDCFNENLTSLNGIEKLVNLQYLDCNNNKLTSIDISKNIKLERLYCDNNKLTSIDLSKNVNLQYLHCYKNQLNIQVLYQQISNNKSIKRINYKPRQDFLNELKHKILTNFKQKTIQ